MVITFSCSSQHCVSFFLDTANASAYDAYREKYVRSESKGMPTSSSRTNRSISPYRPMLATIEPTRRTSYLSHLPTTNSITKPRANSLTSITGMSIYPRRRLV